MCKESFKILTRRPYSYTLYLQQDTIQKVAKHTQKRHRLLWTQAHLHWTNVLWSDESTFEIVVQGEKKRTIC